MFRFLTIALFLTFASPAFAGTAKATDQEITRRVNDRLRTGWFSQGMHRVSIQVKNGEVTLTGSIKTDEDRARLEKEVLETQGVANVINKLRVQQKPQAKPKEKNSAPSE
ncbi:BON domain-containing protein [Estrella lausannensis]|uniref:Putative secreted protein n=1 Tax=Estrella lausannensis TaxID=483423 RepID=A0A0H5DNS5_9BACT|nr:BON domain-containing protein [Estrella lausannensis]CRX37942.1 putative secreted protein [Estrella lausannensis]